jgi:hypothetical protein
MRPPAHIKDVQKLTGCLVVLSLFISRLAERTLPFFKLLRKSEPFIWTDEAEEVFQVLKRYLTSPPVMEAPEPGEPPQHQETKEASANGSGSQDPKPAGSPEVGVTAGSQLPKASLAPERQAGPDNTTGSQPPEANSGPGDLEATTPDPPRHFRIAGAMGPQGLIPWR